jgi:NAD(P) transhydrogenase subunit alpha
MVGAMRPGSVLIDLAVERGGNVEGVKADEVVTTENGVKLVGSSNVSRLAATASSLYARNLYAFVETLVDKTTKALAVKWDDELVRATNLTRDGAIVHTSFGGATAPAAPPQTASQPEVARADGAATTTGQTPSTADAVTL